jgi:hypothetical protein
VESVECPPGTSEKEHAFAIEHAISIRQFARQQAAEKKNQTLGGKKKY